MQTSSDTVPLLAQVSLVPKTVTDQEVYCRLKKALSAPYAITAEPQSSYFSEWQFEYRVMKAGREVARWQGDYRVLPSGTLVKLSEAWLQKEGLEKPW